MHAEKSKRKQPSSSRQFNCPIGSPVLLSNRYAILCDNDEVTDDQIPLQFDVPGDGSCLFWSVTLAYLIPVIDDDSLFEPRYRDLFGDDETVVTKWTCVKTSIRNYNPLSHCVPKDDVLENLVRNTFRNRVVDFMENHFERFECFSEVADEQYRLNARNPDTWSGNTEIQAVSLILKCRINVDGQIFPVLSNNEELTHDPKITLWLFHVNRSTGDAHYANHYNYGLDEKLLESFQEKLVYDVFNLLKKHFVEKTKADGQEHNADYYYNEAGNNLSDKLSVCDVVLEKDAEDISSIIDKKVVHRTNSEVELEDVCLHELAKLLEEYKEDLKQANQPENKDSNETIYSLFQNPKYVATAFRTLKDIPEKFELLKCAFVVLKVVIDELYSVGNYDLVIEIADVEEVDSIKNTILQKDSSDMVVLQFQRIVAQTKNKKYEHEDALGILDGILEKIKHTKCSTSSDEHRVQERDSSKFYFSFLILSDIAFTKHLMGKCKESYHGYKDLYEKIMDHIGINSGESRLTYKTYKEISKSMKYKSILAIHREYLNIFHVREGIAHELLCLGVRMRDSLWSKSFKYCNKTFNEIVEYFQDALNLRKDNFEIKRIDAEFRQDVGMSMRDIATSYEMFGYFKGFHEKKVGQNQTIESVNEALNCYYKSLEMHSVSLTNPELWSTNPVNSKFLKEIVLVLKRISFFYKEYGRLQIEIDPKAAVRNFEKALNIAEKLCNFPVLFEYLGKSHKYHMLRDDMAFINTKLGDLKTRYNPEDASSHCKKADEISVRWSKT